MVALRSQFRSELAIGCDRLRINFSNAGEGRKDGDVYMVDRAGIVASEVQMHYELGVFLRFLFEVCFGCRSFATSLFRKINQGAGFT